MTRNERIYAAAIIASGTQVGIPETIAKDAVEILKQIEKLIPPEPKQPIYQPKEMDTFYPLQ